MRSHAGSPPWMGRWPIDTPGDLGIARVGGARVQRPARMDGTGHQLRLLAARAPVASRLALVLRPVVRVTAGLVALGFRTWLVRRSRMIEHHRDLLERRTQCVLVGLTFGGCNGGNA